MKTKKKIFLSITFGLSTLCMLIVFGTYIYAVIVRSGWKKGNWPVELKSNFKDFCKTFTSYKMSSLGAYEKRGPYCDCLIDKLEQRYTPGDMENNIAWHDLWNRDREKWRNPDELYWMSMEGKKCFEDVSYENNKHNIDTTGKKWSIIEINSFYSECTKKTSAQISDKTLEEFDYEAYCGCMTEKLSIDYPFDQISTLNSKARRELSLTCKP